MSGFQLGKYRCSTLKFFCSEIQAFLSGCQRRFQLSSQSEKKNVTFPIAQPVMLAFLQTCLSCTCWVVVKELVCNYKGVNFSIACTFSFYQIGMNISHSSVCCNWNKLQHLLLKTELFVAIACPFHLKFPSHTSASQDAFEGRFMCFKYNSNILQAQQEIVNNQKLNWGSPQHLSVVEPEKHLQPNCFCNLWMIQHCQ